MSGCDFYTNPEHWHHSGRMSREFEAHLKECPACRAEVDLWRRIQSGIRDVEAAKSTVLGSGGDRGARILLARVRHTHADTTWWRGYRPVLVGATAVAILALLAVAVLRPAETRKRDTPAKPVFARHIIFADGHRETVTVTAQGYHMRAPEKGRSVLAIGKDIVGLDGGGNLRVEQADPSRIRLALRRGTVACAVSPRRAGESFVVTSGDVEVRVVGTRFTVERADDGALAVAVFHGAVEVATVGDTRRLVPGDRLAIGLDGTMEMAAATGTDRKRALALLSRELTNRTAIPDLQASEPGVQSLLPAPGPGTAAAKDTGSRSHRAEAADLQHWRSLALAGRFDEASRGLRAHLHRTQGDTDAWSLLADCERKQQRWPQAVDAYRKVIDLAPGAQAGRARFRAAAILADRMGDHQGAAALLEQYLAGNDKGMRGEAMVRLGTAWLAIGRTQDAQRVLTRVCAEFAGTPEGKRAGELLESLNAKDAI